MSIKIATRSSKLALWQAEDFKSQLRARHPTLEVTLVPITTSGDKILGRPLRELDGKVLFIKELEEAMMRGEADIAVHCMKDFHRVTPDGFAIAAILERESDRDVILARHSISSLSDLPTAATVGTTSLRRAHELRRNRPDLVVKTLRGNVTTRLASLTAGHFDAIILAEAGLNRLGLRYDHCHVLSDDEMLPCGGQGALGIEVLSGNEDVIKMISVFHHQVSAQRVTAERAFVSALKADCGTSVGISSRIENSEMRLMGFVGDSIGVRDVRATVSGAIDGAEELGIHLATILLQRGAQELLEIKIS